MILEIPAVWSELLEEILKFPNCNRIADQTDPRLFQLQYSNMPKVCCYMIKAERQGGYGYSTWMEERVQKQPLTLEGGEENVADLSHRGIWIYIGMSDLSF